MSGGTTEEEAEALIRRTAMLNLAMEYFEPTDAEKRSLLGETGEEIPPVESEGAEEVPPVESGGSAGTGSEVGAGAAQHLGEQAQVADESTAGADAGQVVGVLGGPAAAAIAEHVADISRRLTELTDDGMFEIDSNRSFGVPLEGAQAGWRAEIVIHVRLRRV